MSCIEVRLFVLQKFLNQDYSLKNHSGIYFAGQMTGVEGYVESAQSGIVAGMNMVRYLNKQKPVIFPQETIMGALAYYITHCDESNFQPMKANFGILPDLPVRVKKKLRKEAYANRAIEVMDQLSMSYNQDKKEFIKYLQFQKHYSINTVESYQRSLNEFIDF